MTLKELQAENKKLRFMLNKCIRLISLSGAMFFREERNFCTDEMAANHFKLLGRLAIGSFHNPFDEAIEQQVIFKQDVDAVKPRVLDWMKRESDLYDAGLRLKKET